MVFKFKPYSIIILRPVGQHIYTFQYFFNSTIFNQLTQVSDLEFKPFEHTL